MDFDNELATLRATVDGVRRRTLPAADLCSAWRAQGALLDALPPRYRTVMEDLLGRLEAGSLFAEESCSFSQEDLLGGLDAWLDKARDLLSR